MFSFLFAFWLSQSLTKYEGLALALPTAALPQCDVGRFLLHRGVGWQEFRE